MPRHPNQHLEVLVYRNKAREARVEREPEGDWWIWLRDAEAGTQWRVRVEAGPVASLAARRMAREWVEYRRQTPPGHRNINHRWRKRTPSGS